MVSKVVKGVFRVEGEVTCLAKTFSETPPAYGRQKRRSLTVTGDAAIQGEIARSAGKKTAWPDSVLQAEASIISWLRVALSGSSTSVADTNPSMSCRGKILRHQRAYHHCLSSYPDRWTRIARCQCILWLYYRAVSEELQTLPATSATYSHVQRGSCWSFPYHLLPS